MQYKNSKIWIKSNFQCSTLHEIELAVLFHQVYISIENREHVDILTSNT